MGIRTSGRTSRCPSSTCRESATSQQTPSSSGTFVPECVPADLPSIQPGGAEDRALAYAGPAKSDYQRTLRGRARRLTLHYAFQPSEFERAAMECLRPGQNWTALPPELKVGRFAKIRRYDATTLLRRLSLELPAFTINTKFNDATTGAYIHPTQNRTLSLGRPRASSRSLIRTSSRVVPATCASRSERGSPVAG